MTKKSKYSVVQRVLALALALVLGFSLLPTDGLVTFATSAKRADGTLGVVQTADDPHTLTRPGDTFESSAGVGSTLNAGKILVGKSVTDGIKDGTNEAEALDLSGELTNMPSGSTTSWLPGQNNFLVTISQSSQMYGITSKIPVPLDVVFVIDTSGSMDERVDSDTDRADAVMAAANSAIKTLLDANDDNRVGVVAFSGDSGKDSNATTVLTALGHYSTTSDHLTMSRNGNLTGKTGSRNARSGGTNIQAGIAAGAQMLMNATDLTVQYGDRTVTRIPVLIILSDGAPTFSSSALDWTNPTGGENGRGSEDRGVLPGEGFLPMLTAAYYKNAITQRYYGNSATSDQRAFVYTIGVGLGTIQQQNNGSYRAGDVATLANLTMNPSDWLGISISNTTIDDAINTAWTNYQNKTNFTINVGQYTNGTKTYSFKYHATSTDAQYNIDPSVTDLRYNDEYWLASSTEEINSAFSEMVIEIQKRAITAPTLTNTTWGQDYSGFVTFTDPIGEYMEVKNIIGVTGDGYLYQGIGLGKLAEGYDPNWETDSSTTEEQAVFNAALEQAFKDRMSLSTAAGAATPTLAQVRSILDVITRIESEGDVTYDAGGGNTRTFDYATYGGQLYYESDTDYGNSFVWFGKVHYPDGETEASANDDYDVQFIGVAPKNADSIDWLHNGGSEAEALLTAAKAAGANCIVRSYFMYGAADGSREGEPADMLHFQLRVITSLDEPHQQYVSIKAPASLLATQKVLIDDTDPNNLEAHYNELIPSRVIYEVGLRSDINANNVWNIVDEGYLTETLSDGSLANVNSDGTINFYTNDWDRAASVDSHERALTHANFEVSDNNSFYRYEKNTALYDMNGNPLTTKPVAGQQYQYERTYYTWTTEADGVSKATKHTVMITVTAPADQTVVDAQAVQDTAGTWGGVQNQWYIRAGVYSDNTLTAGDDIEKSANTTGTAAVVTHPTRDAATSDPKYTTWLGNNGKLLFYGVKPKSVTGDDITTSAVETDAEIDGKAVKVGDILTYTIQAVNTETAVADIVITDTIPVGTELVADSITASVNGTSVSNVHVISGSTITWTFADVAVDAIVKVSFQVKVAENAVSESTITNQADITVGSNNYDTNVTSNPVTGKQAGTSSGEAVPADGLKIGDTIEYKIAYYNTSDKVATITVTDVVPEGTTVAVVTEAGVTRPVTSHPTELTWDQSTDPDTLTWKFENVQPGTGGVVTFAVIIDASIEKITVDGSEELGVQNSASYIVKPENESGVTIVTNPTFTPVDDGDLQLKKKVEGTTPAEGTTFELVLTESTGKLNGTFGTTVNGTAVDDTEFKDGVAKVSIKADDTIVITGLPEGVIITVTETVRAGYTPSFHLGDDKNAAAGSAVTISSETVGKVFVLNTYSATATDDISTMFSLKKTLTSPVDLDGKSFTFIAQAADASGNLLTGDAAETLTASVTVADGETKEITFSGKSFSEAGTYYYLVTEYVGSLEGITYDTAQYLVTITVTDDGAGKLVVDKTNGGVTVKTWDATNSAWTAVDAITFTNSYKPADVSITLTGTKELTGRDLIAGEFTFKADEIGNTDLEGNARTDRDVVRYGHHDADGNITFDPIFYSEEGFYTYEITELNTTGQKYVEFDTTKKTVVVSVTSTDGVLSAAVVDTSDAIAFGNKYTTQDVTVTPAGTKTLTNRANGSFSFGVYEWDSTKGAKKSETAKSTGTVTITVADTATEIVFSPITYSLDSFTTKPNGSDAEETFTYMVEELVPTVGADAQITYDLSRYTFQVKLSYDTSSGELTAAIVTGSWKKITDSTGATLAEAKDVETAAFTNLYTPPKDVIPNSVSTWPQIVKKVTSAAENGQIPAGLTFGFQLLKAADAIAPDGSVIDDGYNVGDVVGSATSAQTPGGEYSQETSIAFSTLTFYEPGVYKSWIVENNAGQTVHGVQHEGDRYLMVITVTMEADGTLTPVIQYFSGTGTNVADYTTEIKGEGSKVTFENIYSASGTLTISTAKYLQNLNGSSRPLTDGMFDFTLTEETAGGASHIGANTANGVITFDTLTFINDGFTNGKKTLTYIMKETPGVLPGITYDKSEYRITVELTEKDGAITGEVVKIEKIVNADGTALSTAEVLYDKANSIGTAPSVNGTTVTIGTATQDSSSGAGSASGAAFTNKASNHTGSEITIPVSKVLTGRDMKDNEFSFTLTHVGTSVNGTAQTVTSSVVDTVLVSAKGAGTADEMSFYREYGTSIVPGTVITYHIAETPGSAGGVTYDKSVYEVKVTISDKNNDGDLEAAVTSVTKIQNADGTAIAAEDRTALTTADIDFANTYAVASTTLTLEGNKTLTGRDVTAGEFVFEVNETGFTPIGASTAQAGRGLVTTGTVGAGEADASVTIAFDPITYYEAGTYVYTVKERAGNRANVTYSQAEYQVTVTVTDKGDGTLEAEVTSTTKTKNDDGTDASGAASIAFTNVYAPTELNIAPHLSVNKVLTGREMNEHEFDFVVREVSYNETATAGKPIVSYGDNGAAADGASAAITFASFTVKAAGTYVYEITEGSVTAPNVTADSKVITVTVVVTDDGNGKLSVDSITYTDSDSAVTDDDQTFNNVYTPTPVSQQLIATKYLTGLELKADQFAFTAALQKQDASGNWLAVTDDSGSAVTITAKNAVGGLVTFESYEFTVKGEYRWVITEDKGTSPTGGTMNYDTSTYYVHVTVTDDTVTGKLSITDVTYKKGTENASAVVFNNTFVPTEQYKPLDAVLKPNGSKVLNGREMKAGEFTFKVTDIQGNEIATGTNDAKGNIIFTYKGGDEGIKFSSVGTYFYTVTEVKGTGAGVTYDSAQWTVRFDVTQDSTTGKLIVSDPVVTAVTGTTATDTTKVVFTNSYDPADAEVVLKGYKTLTGRDMRAGEFEFHLLNSAGNVVAKGYNDADGVITFEKLTFETATTAPLKFTIVEVSKSGNGVSYDDAVINVEITVTDNTTAGKLVPSVTIDSAAYDESKTGDNAQIKFTNSYESKPVDVTIQAGKEITGKVLENGEFTFALTDADGKNVVAPVTNDADGNIVFTVPVAAVGEYTWYISEKAGDNSLITYDNAKYAVVVKVVDNLSGNLVVESIQYQTTGGVIPVFENVYTPEPITVTLTGTKSYENKTNTTLTASMFTFEVKDADGNVVGTGHNDKDGNITIDLEFDAPGTYEYKVTEKNTQMPGMTYDDAAFDVVIEVVAEDSGELTYTVTYSNGTSTSNIVFENTYAPAPTPVVLVGRKELTGKDLVAGKYTFTVKQKLTANGEYTKVVSTGTNDADGVIIFEEIEGLDEVGTYYLQITEDRGSEPKVTYDTTAYEVIVIVTDEEPKDGKLDYAVQYVDGEIVFKNSYKADSVDVEITAAKELANKNLTDGEFTFVLKDEDGKENTVTNNAAGEIKFSMNYTEAGTYTYTLYEKAGSDSKHYTYDGHSYEVVVTVTDNTETGKLEAKVEYQGGSAPVFKNVYTPDPITVTLTGTKVLTSELANKELTEGLFTFEVKDADGNVVGSGINAAGVNGSAAISIDVEFTEPGEYVYTVTEKDTKIPGMTYDTDTFKVTVIVTRNMTTGALEYTVTYPNGGSTSNIEFQNHYKPQEVPVVIVGQKELTGKDLEAGKYSFVVEELMNGQYVPVVYGTNGDINDSTADPSIIRFAQIDGLGVGTHTYRISEVAGNEPGVTYSKETFEVVVTIWDESGKLDYDVTYPAGGLTFKNTYKAAPVDVYVGATKEITGKLLETGEFTFKLQDEHGNDVVAPVTNATNGSVEFKVNITEAGTYTWTMFEEKGTDSHITYDGDKYTVTVVVEDNTTIGKLEVISTTYKLEGGTEAASEDAPVFENTYTPDPVSVILEATKTLTGKELHDGMFTFLVKDAADGSTVTSGTNEKDGSVEIKVEFAEPGTYEYVIVEQDDELGGFEYDLTEHPVTITVTADDNGVLHAEVKYANGTDVSDIVIENTYDAKDCEVTLIGTKTLTGGGKKLEAGYFRFVVTEHDAASNTDIIVARGTNDASGKITFYGVDADGNTTSHGIVYSTPGTHYYVVSEVKGDEPGMTYDTAKYNVTVVVEDVNGDLIPTVTYSDGTSISNIKFENTFEPVALKVTLEGKKTLMGREQQAGEFKFEVRDSSGTLVATGTNTASGKIEFSPVTIQQAGTYTLTITEVHNGLAYVNYDLIPRTVTIVVTNDNGVLVADVQYPAEGISFVNVYDEPIIPQEPDEPAPDTGDHTMMALWAALSGLSGTTAVGAAGLRRSFHKRRKHHHVDHEA